LGLVCEETNACAKPMEKAPCLGKLTTYRSTPTPCMNFFHRHFLNTDVLEWKPRIHVRTAHESVEEPLYLVFSIGFRYASRGRPSGNGAKCLYGLREPHVMSVKISARWCSDNEERIEFNSTTRPVLHSKYDLIVEACRHTEDDGVCLRSIVFTLGMSSSD
jgi:hypothetical protein